VSNDRKVLGKLTLRKAVRRKREAVEAKGFMQKTRGCKRNIIGVIK